MVETAKYRTWIRSNIIDFPKYVVLHYDYNGYDKDIYPKNLYYDICVFLQLEYPSFVPHEFDVMKSTLEHEIDTHVPVSFIDLIRLRYVCKWTYEAIGKESNLEIWEVQYLINSVIIGLSSSIYKKSKAIEVCEKRKREKEECDVDKKAQIANMIFNRYKYPENIFREIYGEDVIYPKNKKFENLFEAKLISHCGYKYNHIFHRYKIKKYAKSEDITIASIISSFGYHIKTNIDFQIILDVYTDLTYQLNDCEDRELQYIGLDVFAKYYHCFNVMCLNGITTIHDLMSLSIKDLHRLSFLHHNDIPTIIHVLNIFDLHLPMCNASSIDPKDILHAYNKCDYIETDLDFIHTTSHISDNEYFYNFKLDYEPYE